MFLEMTFSSFTEIKNPKHFVKQNVQVKFIMQKDKYPAEVSFEK